eukprot:TRINITY_DN3012_c0_g1_i2.p1 TRINITY_DN3012_c0_g1~~TRINITY_DN3012_c0_g1_i2.p1  ORF type:complete len:106 (+),score=22.65 TRINITY_DN3012_c0_g1_i2:341-658(+)
MSTYECKDGVDCGDDGGCKFSCSIVFNPWESLGDCIGNCSNGNGHKWAYISNGIGAEICIVDNIPVSVKSGELDVTVTNYTETVPPPNKFDLPPGKCNPPEEFNK